MIFKNFHLDDLNEAGRVSATLLKESANTKVRGSAPREVSFVNKLTRSFPSADYFYKLSTSLTLIPLKTLNSLHLWLLYDWGDNVDEELYNKSSISSILPTSLLSGRITVAESFGFDNVPPSEDPINLKSSLHVPFGLANFVFYCFLVDEENKIVVKAKVYVNINENISDSKQDLLARSIIEREDRRLILDQQFQTKERRPAGAASVGIFNKEKVRKVFEELQNIPRPNLLFIVTNDMTHLALRIYFPPSGTTDAIAIYVTPNNIFHDVAAYKLSTGSNIKVYVAELRGFGYSGGKYYRFNFCRFNFIRQGPRGDAPYKEKLWEDMRSFVRHAMYHNPKKPIFLVGHFYTCGAVLNYDSWSKKVPVDGYIFLSPNIGFDARGTIRKDVLKAVLDDNAVQAHFNNILISSITCGAFKGHDIAFHYNFPEEIYIANPMTVDDISVNAAMAFHPQNAKKQFRKLSRPMLMLVAENDDILRPEALEKYANLVTTEGSQFKLIPGKESSSITILSESVPDVKEWLEKVIYQMKDTTERNTIARWTRFLPAEVDEHIVLDEITLCAFSGSDILLDSIESVKKKSLYNSTFHYMESFDGCRLAYQHYQPKRPSIAILVLWVDYTKDESIRKLCDDINFTIFRFDVRGTGKSEAGIIKKHSLLEDIKLSVLICKKNFPGFVTFIGGQGLTASLVLNYATWKGAVQANAYLFMSPLPAPTSRNSEILLNAPFKANLKKRLYNLLFRRRKFKSRNSNIFTFDRTAGGKANAEFSHRFLKSTLAKDLLGQLLALETPFAVCFGTDNEIIRAENVVSSVCALAKAPMHFSETGEGLSHVGPIEPGMRMLKPWLERVSTSLNPQPNPELFSDVTMASFEKLELVGKGTFGHVWLVRHRDSGKYLAMKILNKVDIVNSGLVDQVIRERDILKTTIDPFIVPFAGSFQDDRHIYLLMEFLVGGELYTLLRIHLKLSIDMVRFYAAEILVALSSLHDRGIVYRDLKPENVLLDALGHVRLIDFGLSRRINGTESCSTFCGSPFYMAPEMISSKSYSFSVDIWAYGVMIFELLTGTLPFNGRSPTDIYRKIMCGVINWPSVIDSDAKDLISKILDRDITKRLGAISLDPKGHPLNTRPSSSDLLSDRSSILSVSSILTTKTMKERYDASSQRYNAIMRHKFFKGVDWDLIRSRAVLPPFQPTVGSEGDTSNFVKFAPPRRTAPAPVLDTTHGDPFANF